MLASEFKSSLSSNSPKIQKIFLTEQVENMVQDSEFDVKISSLPPFFLLFDTKINLNVIQLFTKSLFLKLFDNTKN